jgi:hypothetical protein
VGRPARPFFMFEARGPQGIAGHVTALEPTSAWRQGLEPEDTRQRRSTLQLRGEVRSHGTRDSIGVHLSQQARSRARGHMAPLEPTSAGRRRLEPWDTWQRRSPPQLGGEVQSQMTCGSTRAHLSWEVRSGAIGHATALKPTSAKRPGPELRDT